MTVPAAAGGDKKNIVKMAYIYFQEGRWDKAIEEYKKLIALDPDDVNTHNMLGDVYVKKGAVREAFDEYIKVSSDFSTRGQADKAVIVNKKIANLDSSKLTSEGIQQQNLIRETIRAESAMESGDVDGAIEALREVSKLDKDNLAAYSKLGELYEKKGLAKEAVEAYMHVGDSFLKSRVLKKAQEIYQKVVNLEPNHLDARSNLAQIFLKQGSEGEAKKEFLVLAELALNVGDLERAQQNASKAIELKSIEAHYIQGVVLFKKQQFSEAKTELDNLLRFKVNHVGALAHLARVLMEQNQLDKANEVVQRALKVEKDNPMVLEVQAELAMKRGAKAEATQAYKSLLDRAEAKGDFTKASEYARFLVSLDENSVVMIGKLGEMLKSAGDKKDASDTFFKNVMLLEKQGKNEEAAQWARKTLELNPGHAEAQKRIVGQVVASAPAPEIKPAQPPASEIQDPTVAMPPHAETKVMDLEGLPETNPVLSAPRPAPVLASPSPSVKATVVELEQEVIDEWKAELSIADNFIKQGMLEEAIEICQRLAETYPDKPEIKERLNQAYQAYVKTGDDVIGALEAERKAKEDEERNLRVEMEKKAKAEADRLRIEIEQKARQEAEAKAKIELERKAREEVERKAREEADQKVREETERLAREAAERVAREEAEKKAREEMDRKAREEAELKVRAEAERKAKEEAERKSREEIEKKIKEDAERKTRVEVEKKMREEMERKVREEMAKAHTQKEMVSDLKSFKLEPTSKSDSVLEEGKDDFMTIAVADIYTRQGLHEEAAKIYRRILQNEPDNLEARKKLSDVEKLVAPASAVATPPAVAALPTPPEPVSKPEPEQKLDLKSPAPEKDSGGKKKSNRVGYV
jgi:tetratricopeptide (TPR) repeat protein